MSEEGVDGRGGAADSGLEASTEAAMDETETPVDTQEEGGSGEKEDSMEETEQPEVDLKSMADDYAKYLVVESPKDVSGVVLLPLGVDKRIKATIENELLLTNAFHYLCCSKLLFMTE